MNCIIVDDEPLAREGVLSIVSDIGSIQVIGSFSNALTALDFMKHNPVDLIFLDIHLPQVTGLEFAAQLPKETLIIFTTAYPQYALKSYELDAIDYLLKPLEKERLEKAVNKAVAYKKLLSGETVKNTIEGNTTDFLLIKSDRRYYKVPFQEIRFIEGLKDYIVIHTNKQKLITAMNLKTVHLKIATKKMIRVSKSYIVNMDHIDSFDNHTIYIGEFEIPLGEIFRKDFFDNYSKGTLGSEL